MNEKHLFAGLVGFFLAALTIALMFDAKPASPNTDLAKRKAAEAIKECADAGGTVELLYYEGPGTYYLHACSLTPGRVEVR